MFAVSTVIGKEKWVDCLNFHEPCDDACSLRVLKFHPGREWALSLTLMRLENEEVYSIETSYGGQTSCTLGYGWPAHWPRMHRPWFRFQIIET